MHHSQPVNVAIFVSGNGTNCENLIRYFNHNDTVHIALVVSSKRNAYALERAKRLGIETVVAERKDFNEPSFILPILEKYSISFIVLAGFLLMIPDWLIARYDHRMINIHPALLPRHGGKGMYGRHVHEAVKADGDKETGMTVHWVSNECDGGEIIAQIKTSVEPDDSVDDIAEKEHELEMKYFPEIVEKTIREKLMDSPTV